MQGGCGGQGSGGNDGGNDGGADGCELDENEPDSESSSEDPLVGAWLWFMVYFAYVLFMFGVCF